MEAIVIQKKRKNIDVPIDTSNPSPSNDAFFVDSSNLNAVTERVSDYKNGNSKTTVELHSAEDITNFINSL